MREDRGEHHRGLARQLRRLGLSPNEPPDAARWRALLHVVSTSYREADDDRYTLERSLAVSSEEMRALHEVLSEQARHDPLTGLPNRATLTELVAATLVCAQQSGQVAAVLFIDLDGFKLVNDSLGHAAGDELLVRAGQRIREAVRSRDVVARLGGDEFVVLCTDVGDSTTATTLARRITARFAAPFHVRGQDAVVGTSIGVALTGPGFASSDDLLRRADLAMYVAKTSGGARVAVFDEDVRLQTDARLATERALRDALARDELVLHYQPIVRLSDDELLGVEALVRWDRPGHGLLLPARFVPVAEAAGLISVIDTWVVQQACRVAASWPGPVAVNLSARSLEHDDIVDAITSALHRSALSPQRLSVEVTETALRSDESSTARNLARIQALGVQLTIDDAGADCLPLSFLRRHRARTVKIDQSVVTRVDEDDADAAIVAALIAVSHALGLRVVAEGVERASQAARLRALGCDAAQGYLFASPRDLPPGRAQAPLTVAVPAPRDAPVAVPGPA